MLNNYKRITNNIVSLVNNVSGQKHKTLNTLAPLNVRKNIAALANYCSEKRLVVGTSGQISFRLPAKKFIVTSPSISFSRLSSSDFEIYSLKMDLVELENINAFQNIHEKIFQQSKFNAVLICHPIASLSIAAKGCKIDQKLLEISPEVLTFTTENDFIISEFNYQENEKAVILIKGFGMITYGSTVEETIDKAETVERLCQIMLNVL